MRASNGRTNGRAQSFWRGRVSGLLRPAMAVTAAAALVAGVGLQGVSADETPPSTTTRTLATTSDTSETSTPTPVEEKSATDSVLTTANSGTEATPSDIDTTAPAESSAEPSSGDDGFFIGDPSFLDEWDTSTDSAADSPESEASDPAPIFSDEAYATRAADDHPWPPADPTSPVSPDPAKIPAPKKDPRYQCGLTLDLMIDVSGSINEQEMQKIKKAALATIEKLENTPTKLAISTFAGDVPSCYEQRIPNFGYNKAYPGVDTLLGNRLGTLNMNNPEHIKVAKQRISYLRSYDRISNRQMYRDALKAQDLRRICGDNATFFSAKTNWQGAFEYLQEPQNPKFDAVLFLTDGVPTQPYGNATSYSSKQNLQGAYDAAQSLRDSGTVVYGIGVGLEYPSDKIVLDQPNIQAAPNDVKFWRWDDENNQRYDVDGVEITGFKLVEKGASGSRRYKDPSELTITPNPSKGENYYFDRMTADEYSKVKHVGDGWFLQSQGQTFPVYRANGLNAQEAMEAISDRFALVQNFDAVKEELVNSVSGCDLKFDIEKSANPESQDVTLTETGTDEYSVTYKLKVTNESGAAGRPSRIIEKPNAPEGLSVTKVSFSNSNPASGSAPAGDLLEGGDPFEPSKNGEGQWTVPQERLAEFAKPQTNGTTVTPVEKFMYVTVTYQAENAAAAKTLYDNDSVHSCEKTSDAPAVFDPTKGLVNEAKVEMGSEENPEYAQSSQACVNLEKQSPPEYIINKEAVSDPVNVDVNGTGDVTVTYRVTVTNSNGVAGFPEKIVETPGSVTGLTASNVVFKNQVEGQDAGDLLKSENSADTTKDGDSYTLTGSDTVFNNIDANGSKVVYAVVTYTRGTADELRDLREGNNAQCDNSQAGKGLTNKIEVSRKTNDQDGQANACTSVIVSKDPAFVISKSGDAPTVGMQLTAGGSYDVSYTLTVNNTSDVAGVPAKISETPGTLPGLTITKVVYENLSGSNLVKGVKGKVEKTSAPWDLTSADMNSLPQRGKAQVRVTVTYNGGTAKEMKDLRDSGKLTCNRNASGDNTNGPGLRNTATITNIDGTHGETSREATACTSITFPTDPEFAVTKESVDGAIAPKTTGKDFDVKYKVTVRNTSTIAGTPFQIIDSPKGLTGVTAQKVVFSNGDLLKGNQPVTINGTQDTYVLNKDQMVEIPGGQSREVFVTVTYRADKSGTAYKDLLNSGNLKCGDEADNVYPEGKGLRNVVESVNKEGDDPQKGKDEACTDITKPDAEFDVTKAAQDGPALATPAANGTFDVEYTVTVTNKSLVNGKPFKIVDSPKAPAGITVKKVVFSNGSLLSDGNNPTTIDEELASYELTGEKMVEIPAGKSKEVKVIVTYRATDEDSYKTLLNDSTKLTCGDENNGDFPDDRGLVNAVESFNKDGADPQKGNAETCKKITPPKPTFSVTKVSKGGAVAKATEQDEFDVVYTISVTNTSLVNAAPSKIVESPKPPKGITVQRVTFNGGDLLSNGDVTIEGAKTEYELAQASMVEVPAGETKTVDVTITYKGTDTASYKDLLNSDRMACEDGKPVGDNPEAQKGLGNSVTVTNVDGNNGETNSGEACTDLNPPAPTFNVSKAPVEGGNAPAAEGETFTVKYKLTVSNTSNVNGAPFKIVENPHAPEGLEVTNVTFEGGNLLNGTDPVSLDTAPYELDQSKMNSIDANGKKEVFVVVTYQGTTKDAYRDYLNSGKLECGTKTDGDYPDDKGLVNSVTTVNADGQSPQEDTDEACQTVTPPQPYFSVVKTSEGNAVAAGSAADSFTVKYRIEVTNDSLVNGKPVSIVDDPSAPEGIKAIKAVFSNGDLLDGKADTTFEINAEQDTYELPADKMVSIDSGASKFVFVTITYQGTDADAYKALLNDSAKLKCGTEGADGTYPKDKGLVNAATVTNPGAGNKPNKSDEACTPIDPPAQGELTVAKKLSNADDFAVLSPGSQAVVTYLIEVSNPESNFKSLLPANLIDSPKPPVHVSVVAVEAHPVTGLADPKVELLKDDANAAFDADGDSWKLTNDKFREIEPGKTGVVKVVVTYEADADFGADGQNTDDLECSADGADGANKGLYNKATLEGQTTDNPDDSACVPVKHGKVTVEKKINDTASASRDDAVDVSGTADSVEISYEITNSGTAELSEVVVSDVVLDENDNPTQTPMSQNGLTCDNNGTFDAATKKVTFDPAVAAGNKVTCSWTLNVADIPEDDIHDQIHGDQVTATPGYTGPGGTVVPGGDTTGKGWMKFGSVLTVTKRGLADEVAISDENKASVEVSYLVSVTNGGKRPAPLPDLVDTPQPAAGITVTNVKAEQAGAALTADAIELINAEVDPLDNAGDTWTLAKANYAMPLLEAGKTAEVILTVTYDMSSVDVENPADDLACDATGSNEGRGVSNKVTMDVNGEEEAGEGCVSVTPVNGTVVKKINGQEGGTKDTAAPVLNADTANVEVSYEYNNTGKATVRTLTIEDVYVDVDSGDATTEPVPGDLTCESTATGTTFTINGNVVELTPGLSPGDTVTCSRTLTPEKMKWNGEYHADKVTITPGVTDGRGNITPGPSSDDEAWAVKLPALVGNLPDTGGNGLRLPLLVAFGLMLAGAAAATRRRRV